MKQKKVQEQRDVFSDPRVGDVVEGMAERFVISGLRVIHRDRYGRSTEVTFKPEQWEALRDGGRVVFCG